MFEDIKERMKQTIEDTYRLKQMEIDLANASSERDLLKSQLEELAEMWAVSPRPARLEAFNDDEADLLERAIWQALQAANGAWLGVTALHTLAMDHGFTASAGTLRNRLSEARSGNTLLARHPDLIEERNAPKAWRLRQPKVSPKRARATAPAKALTKSSKAKSGPVAAATAVIGANDQIAGGLAIVPRIVCGDGLALMRELPDAIVPLVIADLPYGTTDHRLDAKINVQRWMDEMMRIVTDRGAVLCFCAEPFRTKLMVAAEKHFKQDLIWEKPNATGFHGARARHLKAHESILVFSKGSVLNGGRSLRQMTYNPQGAVTVARTPPKLPVDRDYYVKSHNRPKADGANVEGLANCPRSVLRFAKDYRGHPFAKPIALLEYLIQTFSHPSDLVLDPTMGSGSCAIAASNTGRSFIGAEIDHAMFRKAQRRIAASTVGEVA